MKLQSINIGTKPILVLDHQQKNINRSPYSMQGLPFIGASDTLCKNLIRWIKQF